MRLDIRNKDDVEQLIKCYRVDKVTLDGVRQPGVLMADDELGEVLRFKTHPNGNLIVDPETGDAVTEMVYGVVKFIFRESEEHGNL